MPEYLAPGVYVEETSFRSKIIEGVSTTTTAFVGPCRYGPVIEPVDIITSLGEFERTYAGGAKLEFATPGGQPELTDPMDNYLWHAVRAFFSEGGKRLYISRIFRPLSGTDYPPNFEDPLPIPFPGKELGSVLWPDGHARAIFKGTEFRSRFPGAASNLNVILKATASANILGSVLLPETDPFNSIPDQLEPKVNGVREGDVVLVTRGGAPPTLADLYVANFDAVLREWNFKDANGVTQSLKQLNPIVNSAPGIGDSMYVLTASVNVWSSDRQHDLGTWSALSFDPQLDRLGGRDSMFGQFRADPATVGEARSLPLVLGKSSGTDALSVITALFPNLLVPKQPEDLVKFGNKDTILRKLTTVGVIEEFPLLGGNDGFRPGANEYEGKDEETLSFKTGLKQFRDVEDISIIAAPGSTADYDGDYRNNANAIYGHLISHAEFMRYCIAVLDCPPKQTIGAVRKIRAKIDSKYAAFYYPWVTVLDPVTREELNLPPSGFVTGIYARNDVNRAVYKAPANEVVNLAIGFEQLLNKGQQEVLNPEGINCFRFFEGRGFRLWGARTISSDPEWKYVNLRRYFAYLERSIDKGTQWAVFEPNGYALWANVRRTIEDFLLNEFQSGALLGEKPEQAYFVKCDRTTMTQNDLDNGRLIALIGVAALRPAEFVIFRIGQWTADRKS
ncbi:MAG TPA: phage tail sheath subtilisin-like domain-containing protein [Chthoniobacterales bacterium]|nr:phage tail sheath subtilisin-like domain-containing protein [Chthoniobacterales bacterium]